MKRLLLALLLLVSTTAFSAPVVPPMPWPTVDVKNSTGCTVLVIIYASDIGICPAVYTSIIYSLPPGGSIALDPSTITWAGPAPSGSYFQFRAADVMDDGNPICPPGVLPTTCPGGANDICTVGDPICGYINPSCFIIGNGCSSCPNGTIINASASFGALSMTVSIF